MSDEVDVYSYADDFNLLASGVDLGEIDGKLNRALRDVAAWAKRKDLSISAEKSSVTFFTTDPHQHHHHPQVYYGDSLLPLEKNPKLLGVTLDPHFTFGPHVKQLVDTMSGRHKVLKALAGTDWGGAKEDMLVTFKLLGVSVLNYAAPIFFPNLKPTHIRKLQTMQNHCLRVVTGAHAAASLEFWPPCSSRVTHLLKSFPLSPAHVSSVRLLPLSTPRQWCHFCETAPSLLVASETLITLGKPLDFLPKSIFPAFMM